MKTSNQYTSNKLDFLNIQKVSRLVTPFFVMD